GSNTRGDHVPHNRNILVAVYCSTSGLLATWAQPALAQQADSDTGRLQEIVITAEKRESTVQNTPISLTAVSGTDIQDKGLTDLNLLLQSVPVVSMRTSG